MEQGTWHRTTRVDVYETHGERMANFIEMREIREFENLAKNTTLNFVV